MFESSQSYEINCNASVSCFSLQINILFIEHHEKNALNVRHTVTNYLRARTATATFWKGPQTDHKASQLDATRR